MGIADGSYSVVVIVENLVLWRKKCSQDSWRLFVNRSEDGSGLFDSIRLKMIGRFAVIGKGADVRFTWPDAGMRVMREETD